MSKKMFGTAVVVLLVNALASTVWAECPEGKEPVDISTPSGITKTLCIPAAAVEGIENAAENSGGTIVASNCPCFSAEDIQSLDAIEEFTCSGSRKIDIDGTLIFSSSICKSDATYSKVLVSYDLETVNRCYFATQGDKYSGIPAVTIDEVINDSEYDTCSEILASVVSPPK